VNPLDYIYRAVGCRMQLLDPASDPEVEFVMRYMLNSNGARGLNVESIVRVQRSAEADNFAKKVRTSFNHLPTPIKHQ
jgi:hypothetical protein